MSDYPKMIPDKALKYIQQKKLKPSFSYKDVWNEEHAASFTVAKAMQLDVLTDLQGAVEKAIKDGQTFESFKKNIKTTLIKKGWWGKQDMIDPLTGETVHAQLGSDRRLKTIYRTNLRSAYQKGQFDRTMASDAHPYLLYRTGSSVNHREEHLRWNGLILKKTDPWWATHLPPNGWGCKCFTRACTEARKLKYEQEGIPTAKKVDGSGGGTINVKTTPPPDKYKSFVNERKGILERVPEGVSPGFAWNPSLPRDKQVEQVLGDKIKETAKAIKQYEHVEASEFQIAKTINEAKTYALKKLGLKTAEFENFNLSVANMVNEEITNIYAAFGNVGIQEIRYYPKKASWYAMYSPGMKAIFMKEVKTKASLTTMKKQAVMQLEYGFWSSDNAAHTIRHEAGHAIQHFFLDTNIDKREKIQLLRNKIAALCLDKKGWSMNDTSGMIKAKEYLSYYGLKDIGEFVAESVAEYMNGNPRNTAKEVVEILIGGK